MEKEAKGEGLVNTEVKAKQRSVCAHSGHQYHTFNTCWDLHGKPPASTANISVSELDIVQPEGIGTSSGITPTLDGLAPWVNEFSYLRTILRCLFMCIT